MPFLVILPRNVTLRRDTTVSGKSSASDHPCTTLLFPPPHECMNLEYAGANSATSKGDILQKLFYPEIGYSVQYGASTHIILLCDGLKWKVS